MKRFMGGRLLSWSVVIVLCRFCWFEEFGVGCACKRGKLGLSIREDGPSRKKNRSGLIWWVNEVDRHSGILALASIIAYTQYSMSAQGFGIVL